MAVSVVGVISDTHGLVRPEALAALAGCTHIVHAGDVGDAAVLAALARIAPVTAVRGNNDLGAWADVLPASASLVVRQRRLFVVHEQRDVPHDLRADVVVTGHSHRPSLATRDGVLFVNPGSAGPRRFTLPIAVVRLTIADAAVDGEIVTLDATPPLRRRARG